MTADTDAYDLITRRLQDVTGYHPGREGADWKCPAHGGTNGDGDRRPSLSVHRGRDGVVIKCQANCDTQDVVRALGLTMRDLFNQTASSGQRNGQDRPEIDRTYDYVDEHGTLLFQVVRMRPKNFRQRRPDGNGGWDWKIADTRRVLYRLPQVIEAVNKRKRIWIVEGEKDVEALEAAGETATCNPGGAGKWRPEYNQHLRGARITIVADQDDVGKRHAQDLYVALSDVARTIRIVHPTLGKDAADHLGAGLGVDDFAGDPEPRPPLEFFTAAEHAAAVDNAPPTGWLVKPIWPADGHGVVAAEQKAGKTWAALDMAVTVASGTSWLDMWACETTGPVILCLGEGGQRKMLRRLRAICERKSIRYETLPIHVCFRVPHLTDRGHLDALTEKVEEVRPVLVIIDPLYLAARGAKASQLIEMGEHLESVQTITQQAGSALAIIHHWNKTGTGSGASRMTGVGGQEWGRVLLSAAVKSKHTDNDTKCSKVALEFDVIGDEIPEQTFRIRRTVWADDPDDLNSPLHYLVEPMTDEAEAGPAELKPATRRVLNVLLASTEWLSVTEIGDRVAVDGTGRGGLAKRTIQDACKTLRDKDLAVSHGEDVEGQAAIWRALDAKDDWGRTLRQTISDENSENY